MRLQTSGRECREFVRTGNKNRYPSAKRLRDDVVCVYFDFASGFSPSALKFGAGIDIPDANQLAELPELVQGK